MPCVEQSMARDLRWPTKTLGPEGSEPRTLIGRARAAPVAMLVVLVALLALAVIGAGCSQTSPGPPRRAGSRVTRTRGPSDRRVASRTQDTQDIKAGRFTQRVTVGGLTVSPLASGGSRPLGLGPHLAASYTAITGGLASGKRLVGYGSVTLRGVSLPPGTPPLASTPAWVGIAYATTKLVAYSCPAMRIPSSVGPDTPYQPIDTAVIFYGYGGDGAVLYSTGGSLPCGGQAKPTATPADGLVSLPWQQLGPAGLSTTVSYLAPTCARLVSVGAGGNVHSGVYRAYVRAAIPFDRAGCSQVVTRTTTVQVYPSEIGPGAPPPPRSVRLEHSGSTVWAPRGFSPPDFAER